MKGISRRQFVAVTALAGGGVLFALSPIGRRLARRLSGVDPSLYVTIHPDDTIVVTIPKSEMGQGVRTSLAMFVAEEMDADWSKVRVETAPLNVRFGYQGTSGSASVTERFTPLRRVGATARAMLVAAAARQLDAPAGELHTERSSVRHTSSGRAIGYGALSAHLAGTRPPRMCRSNHAPTGSCSEPSAPASMCRASYAARRSTASDVRVPGMRFASIERPREFGGTVKSFDAKAALAVPGVLQVVATPGDASAELAPGIAVIATNTWAALEGRRGLAVEWVAGSRATESTESYRAFMRAAVARPGVETVGRVGDPDGALAAGEERHRRRV